VRRTVEEREDNNKKGEENKKGSFSYGVGVLKAGLQG
jgi:hypothetical protein